MMTRIALLVSITFVNGFPVDERSVVAVVFKLDDDEPEGSCDTHGGKREAHRKVLGKIVRVHVSEIHKVTET
jgi:hypothetical protein